MLWYTEDKTEIGMAFPPDVSFQQFSSKNCFSLGFWWIVFQELRGSCEVFFMSEIQLLSLLNEHGPHTCLLSNLGAVFIVLSVSMSQRLSASHHLTQFLNY